ncbi:2-dehydropantoate 2-reductase [Pseudalkalibacillus sp. Hm43]|uniref:2-dehydropantoate 2-reductase n=1 Tax=Pseudalkalibacillus sp. Hm43 TaxID=3450742 RepID=UPI003F41E9BC
MKVAVIGGGSVGLLYTAHLTKMGHEVELFVRREEQVKTIKENGLLLKVGEGEYSTRPGVSLIDEDALVEKDLLIIAVKSYQLESIMKFISERFERTKAILFVQNGMKHIHLIPELKSHSLFLGIVEHGALRQSDGVIQHTGIGRTKVAPYLDGHSGINWNKLSSDAFPFILQSDWYEMLSRKLHINSVINPLTGLLKVRNGELQDHPEWIKLMSSLSREACRVLQLAEKEAWEDLMAVCKNTSLNKSSMLRDIEQGRKTEIEAINGYLVRLAENSNLKIPNQEFVYRAIKGMEKGRRGNDG